MPFAAPKRIAAVPLAAFLLIAASKPAVREDFLKEENAWRAQREHNLTKPDGWLSVAGLFWLHDGTLALGSDPQSDVVLPARAPKRAGELRVQKGVVTFEPAAGVKALVSGKPATKTVLKPDTDEHPDTLQIGTLTMTVIQRMDRTGIRLRDPEAETRRNFAGLKWYPISPKWRITAKWVKYPTPHKIRITNILGMSDEEPSPGYAEFTVNGKTVRLEPVDEDGSLAFMFKDATSGNATYPPGRFLDTDMPKGDTIVLDFNQTYNPPCAYIAYATCPLPPKQNTLAVAVEAGEKKYGSHPGGSGR